MDLKLKIKSMENKIKIIKSEIIKLGNGPENLQNLNIATFLLGELQNDLIELEAEFLLELERVNTTYALTKAFTGVK
jgi:hypothetical protein